MNATLILHSRFTTPEGYIAEIVIRLVPSPVVPSQHSYKYRAALIDNGKRVLGFDNERGKGDHQHIGGHQLAYTFTTPEQLADDFIAAIDGYRSRP